MQKKEEEGKLTRGFQFLSKMREEFGVRGTSGFPSPIWKINAVHIRRLPDDCGYIYIPAYVKLTSRNLEAESTDFSTTSAVKNAPPASPASPPGGPAQDTPRDGNSWKKTTGLYRTMKRRNTCSKCTHPHSRHPLAAPPIQAAECWPSRPTRPSTHPYSPR